VGTVRAAMLALLVIMVAGCSASPPAARPNVPAFTSAAPTSASREKDVPKTCGGVATLTEVTDILGTAVTGQTLPVVGVPEPKIGRTARLDCYYGVPDGQPVSAAAVWIAFASYTDANAAHRRLASTVETEQEAGAKPIEVAVGPDRGVLLNGAKQRTLVAERGRTTVVVTVGLDLIAENQAGSLLGRLADRALSPR